MAKKKKTVFRRVKDALAAFVFAHQKKLLALSFCSMVWAYSMTMPLVAVLVASGFTALAYYIGFERKRRSFWEKALSFRLLDIDKKYDKLIDSMARLSTITAEASAQKKVAEPAPSPAAARYNRNSRRYDQVIVDDDIILDDTVIDEATLHKASEALEAVKQKVSPDIRTVNVRYQPTPKPFSGFAEQGLSATTTKPKEDIFFSDSLMREFIQNALNNKSFNVVKTSIYRMPERTAKIVMLEAHIEAYTGTLLQPAQYAKVAGKDGLEHKIAAALLDQSIEALARAKDTHLLFGIAVKSTAFFNASFMNSLIGHVRTNRSATKHIVLTLDHDDFETMEPRALQIMRGLAQLGCQFMLTDVATLTPDLDLMQSVNIKSIQIPAAYLTTLMRDHIQFREAIKARRFIEGSGIRLIISGVDDAATATSLQAFGSRHMQGRFVDQPIRAQKSPLSRAA